MGGRWAEGWCEPLGWQESGGNEPQGMVGGPVAEGRRGRKSWGVAGGKQGEGVGGLCESQGVGWESGKQWKRRVARAAGVR